MRHESDNLIVTLSGSREHVDGYSLASTLSDLLAVLTELDREISGFDAGTIRWDIVRAKTESPLTIELRGESSSPASFSHVVVSAYIEGAEAVVKGRSHAPRHFNTTAWNGLRKLFLHCSNGISRIDFSTGGRTVTATASVAESLRAESVELLRSTQAVPREHVEIGEIEGVVETISCHNRYYFSLWERLSNTRVECRFKEELRDTVLRSFEKQAYVTGRIKFKPDGKPQSVDVDEIRLKPLASTLPQFTGERIDITGGIESSEYVRGMRDDD